MSAELPINPDHSTRNGAYRKIGAILLAMPILLYPIIWLWVFADDGDWVVSSDAQKAIPAKRGFVALFFQLQIASSAAITTFLGLLMLYLGQYRKRLIGWLLALSILPAVLGVIVTGCSIYCYFLFAEPP